MSSTDNILDMFITVMQSDMNDTDKFAMIGSLTKLQKTTNHNTELAQDYEEATAPKETFKITLSKPGNADGTVFGHKRWVANDRRELFTIIKDTFGPYSDWKGLVTPGDANYESALEQLAVHFNRTPLSIKSQVRDVIQPCTDERNEKSIRIAKQAAFEAGLINEEVLVS